MASAIFGVFFFSEREAFTKGIWELYLGEDTYLPYLFILSITMIYPLAKCKPNLCLVLRKCHTISYNKNTLRRKPSTWSL